MGNNSSIYNKLLKENISIVNNLLSKLLWGVLAILICFYFFAEARVLRVEGSFIIKWFLCILGLNIIYLILNKMKVSDNVKKYYLIFDTYFEPKEENKVYLTKEELVDYAKLFANKSDKDNSCM